MFTWIRKLTWDKIIGTYDIATPKRARTKKGRYRADDKSTKGVNEAWIGGKAPKKKTKKKVSENAVIKSFTSKVVEIDANNQIICECEQLK